jgi:hypothetical protein
MGTPTCSILSEIDLQFLEHTVFSAVLSQHNILGYFQHVYDILLVYKDNKQNTRGTESFQQYYNDTIIYHGTRKQQQHKLPRYHHMQE